MLHVDELRSRAGSLFLTLRCEVTDTAGAPVLTGTSLMVTAGPDVPAAEPAASGGPRDGRVAVGDALPPLLGAASRARGSCATPARRATSTRSTGASASPSASGLPDVIAHGMLTMALAGRLVTGWTGDPSAVVGYARGSPGRSSSRTTTRASRWS